MSWGLSMRAPALALIAVLAAGAFAGQEELAKAKALRNETGELWDAGKHAEAAEKLREADAIYAKEKGDVLADRAVTLRALCWNEFKAGQVEEARGTFSKLAKLAKGSEAQWDQVWSAYVAAMEASQTVEDLDAVRAAMEEIRKTARKYKYPKIAAQCLHDLAFHLSEKGDHGRAVDPLRDAIKERKKLGDLDGLTWSTNNLANALLKLGRVDDALPVVTSGWELVHEEGRTGPQFSVETRITDALTALRAQETVSPKQARWAWDLTERIAKSTTPQHVTLDVMLRAMIDLDATDKGRGRVLRHISSVPDPASQVDLAIRSARAMTASGQTEKALQVLGGLETVSGPAGPHLTARMHTAHAVLLAAGEAKEKFAESARTAATAWRELGDRAGREAALADIVAGVDALGLSSELSDLVDEYNTLRSSGTPGGAGGSASSQGDRSQGESLGDHDPIFRITLKGERIQVLDLASGAATEVEATWVPREVALNGGTFRFFGGYVVVKAVSYGGGAVTSGSPGAITLDELGVYHAVPASGGLQVTKNGCTIYEQ